MDKNPTVCKSSNDSCLAKVGAKLDKNNLVR